MSGKSVVLIDLLKAGPGKQEALIAAEDGMGVVIRSERETPAAVEAMRRDPRMKACFQKIIELELASPNAIIGSALSGTSR